MKQMKLITAFLLVFAAQNLWAMPIATEVALPVAKDQGMLRVKSTVNSNQGMTTHLLALAYGLHENTALIAALPYKYTKDDSGLADVPVLLRQTFVQIDWPLQTLRLAGIAGLEIPTWHESVSKKNVGLKAGGVFTFQTPRHEVDADLIYTERISSQGIERGNSLAYDLAYQIRIYPWQTIGDYFSQWNLDIEFNGAYDERDQVNGIEQSNTGGHKAYLSAGLQWVAQTKMLEALYQIPVINELHGDQPLSHQFILSYRTWVF